MPRILTFSRNQKSPKYNVFQKLWDNFLGMDRFLKFTIFTMLLLIIISSAIVKSNLDSRQNAAGSACQGMSIAAYYGDPNSRWWGMMASSYPSTRMVVVENTSVSGPGTSVSPGLQSEIAQMKQANIRVFGYVYTSFGNRAVSAVETDIDYWRSLYGVTDIMFDEGPYAPGTSYIPFYKTITDYVHTKTPGSLVELNPAYPIDQGYLQFIDILSVFEGPYSSFLNFQFPSWMTNYPSTKFKAYIHSVPNPGVIPGLLQKVVQDNIGYFDITDATSTQIWGVLASDAFWNVLVPAVKSACNGGPIPTSNPVTAVPTASPTNGLSPTPTTIPTPSATPTPNPADMRDQQKMQGVAHLGSALQAYAQSNNGRYPDNTYSWMQKLVSSHFLSDLLPQIGSVTCWGDGSGLAVNGYCYNNFQTYHSGGFTSTYTWVKLESPTNIHKCGTYATEVYYAWDAASNNACLKCAKYPNPYARSCSSVQ